jgi:hypothetical protein
MNKLFLLNGTNQVGMMNGTNAVNLNGTGDVGGNYSELNGTNAVMLNGCPCSQLNGYDIDTTGLNGTDEEIDAFKLGVLYGDTAAVEAAETGNLNGFLDVLKERKSKRRANRQENKEGRQGQRDARRSRREARFAARQERLGSGGGFFQQLGSGLKDLAPGLAAKLAGETEEKLNELGVYPDEETLMYRTGEQAAAGVTPDGDGTPSNAGLMGWWSKQNTVTKAAVIGGGLLVGYFAAKQFGLIGKKGKKRR